MKTKWTFEDVAIERGHKYATEATKHLRIVNRAYYAELREAYEKGFLDGFTHKMGGGHGDPL